MLEIQGLNYFAVLVAWLINMFVGALWYSPVGFSKQWKKHTGINIMQLPQTEANKALGFVALSSLVQAVVLAIVINSLNISAAIDGLITGIVLWAGLVAATTVGTTFYSKRNWSFWWLNSSYFLVVISINSVLLTIWR